MWCSLIIDGCDFAIRHIVLVFVPFYTIVDYRDNRHLGDSTIVKFTIAIYRDTIYRDNRQYRAPLTCTTMPDEVNMVCYKIKSHYASQGTVLTTSDRDNYFIICLLWVTRNNASDHRAIQGGPKNCTRLSFAITLPTLNHVS